MSESNQVQPLLTEVVAEPIMPSDSTIVIPEGYVDDESGKMNTLEVGQFVSSNL